MLSGFSETWNKLNCELKEPQMPLLDVQYIKVSAQKKKNLIRVNKSKELSSSKCCHRAHTRLRGKTQHREKVEGRFEAQGRMWGTECTWTCMGRGAQPDLQGARSRYFH